MPKSTTERRIVGHDCYPQCPAIPEARPTTAAVTSPALTARAMRRVRGSTSRTTPTTGVVTSAGSKTVYTKMNFLSFEWIRSIFLFFVDRPAHIRSPPAGIRAWHRGSEARSTRDETSCERSRYHRIGLDHPRNHLLLRSLNPSSCPAKYCDQAVESQISQVFPLPTTTTSRSRPA
mgnify:CR=1 FL=1